MKSFFNISLKKATFSDIEFLWYLRNQPVVYKYFRRAKPVNWKEHIDWMVPIILNTSTRIIFIIKNSGISIGQIRFDYKNFKEVEISISILKEFQGKGVATKALSIAIKRIKKQKEIKKIIAEINENNLPSIKLFKKMDFNFKEKKGKWLKYNLQV